MQSRSSLGAALLIAACACSATEDPSSFQGSSTTAGTASGGAGGGGSGGSATGGEPGVGGIFTGGAGVGGSIDEFAEVFGESAENLFKLDPISKEVSLIGPFSPPGEGGCFPVIDIAVDKDSNLFVTTYERVYRVDKNTAECTLITAGNFPNSLSFVPAGTVDPDEEALVAYAGSQYVRIDTATGAITTIGDLGGGYTSSGDIVSVKGGKTLVTVKGEGCSVYDCLLEVDPTTGALIKNWGALPYQDVFGLAFWAGTAYGFAQSGELFQIDFSGDSIVTTPIPIPNPPAYLYFWGAGSTTSAPPVPE